MSFDAGGFGQDALTAGVGAVLDSVGGYFSAKQQYRMNKRMYKHRYQWTVRDMIKAGLNPMLAAGASAPVPGSVSAPDYGSIGSKAASAFMQSRMNRAQVELLNTNKDLTAAQAKEAEMKNTIMMASPEFRQAAEAQDVARQDWTPGTSAGAKARYEAETRRAVAAADLSEIQRDMARSDLTQAQVKAKYADQLGALAARYQEAMTKAAENNVSQTEADKAFWDTVGGWGKSGEFSKQFLWVIAEIVRAWNRSH